jgi:hypothetical protein
VTYVDWELRRFWFEFVSTDPRLRLGVGATGVDEADCIGMIQSRLLEGEPMPTPSRVLPDVDVSTLDAGHVLPNMGLVVDRGIWYPDR